MISTKVSHSKCSPPTLLGRSVITMNAKPNKGIKQSGFPLFGHTLHRSMHSITIHLFTIKAYANCTLYSRALLTDHCMLIGLYSIVASF